ncbi:hypothetical protein GCM10011609_26140 [Lentzea pudingi]|uniref:Short chain dehydrogenase n=1 Tax=Lentzea pudingi TaxID=1789439 RepID=A0ABQ2HRS6_9PSEU|nr:SDR family NAD(P)-dependent oxidoreductase [Lentzea pudingi]GGM88185.1 hypothetical protein GCM10011609_26140 [Lentzea pudingi]
MIALNVSALVDLSRAYIDPLSRTDSGILVNVASLLGFQPTPYLSVYGATKAFVLSFTESLWEETRGTRLRVLAVCPGATSTEFYDVAGSQSADYGTKRATPTQVVKIALDTLDRRSAPRRSSPTAGRSPSSASSCCAARWSGSWAGWPAVRPRSALPDSRRNA